MFLLTDQDISLQQHRFIKAKFYKFAMIFIIIGSLNYLVIELTKINLIDKLKKYNLHKIIYIVIGLSALYVMFDRDTYLPFLGRTIIPCDILTDKNPDNATLDISIDKIKPNSKVIFWAAEPKNQNDNKMLDYIQAYGNFSNSGVATSDNNGTVRFKIRNPQEYKVPVKGTLKPHVHYRVCEGLGNLGKVKTLFL
jgi:uncharacterized membrane protein YuzA (DUF378 family)